MAASGKPLTSLLRTNGVFDSADKDPNRAVEFPDSNCV